MGESSPSVGDGATSKPLADIQLRRATVDDIHRLKTVLAEAFYEDPIISWMMPDERSRRERLRRFFAIELRHLALAQGHVWTSSELTGAAMSVSPGAWRMPPRAVLLEGRNFGVRLYRATRLLVAMNRRHFRQPHYYFRDIGILPEMQGKGLGSALMRPTLDRCDREGLPAYLEASSERSAALYARLGFQLTGELQVAGSPPLWLMLRPPSRSEETS